MSSEEYPLMLKAAWYYYMQNYTQQEISELIGISRAKVIRLLESARETGVIQFNFRAQDSRRMELELALRENFGLADACLVPTPKREEDLGSSIAQNASLYISDHLRAGGFLNIGYGDMTSMVLNQLAGIRTEPMNVVSLSGGVNYYLPQASSNFFQLHVYMTPAPLIVSTPELRDALIKEPSIQHVSQMSKHADLSVIGIGGISESATVIRNGILSPEELELLRMQGAVGDVLNHFFDSQGKLVDTEIESRVISTKLAELKNMNNVCGVAGGPAKVEAIRALLRGGYLDVLISDETTAEALLS